MIITAISFLFLPKLRWSKNIRRLPTITLSRPSPLVRAGKIAIRVCSITLHCQKYYLPRWRGEFERVMLSLTSPPWPMPKVRATGPGARAPVAFYLFGAIQTPLRIQSPLIPWLVTPLLWKRQRGRSSCHHATLLPKNGCWAWPVCGEERCVTTQERPWSRLSHITNKLSLLN